jgi:Acyl-CoA carboxylase epsilon subunit
VTKRSGDTLDAVSGEPTPEERRALFRVVRGGPTDEEVAALTVVLAVAVAAPREPSGQSVLSRWSDPVARFRTPLHPGPGAWKSSFWPR